MRPNDVAPMIVGFNGEFLARSDRVPPARLEWYGALGRAAAESARVPCAVMFNECPDDAWVVRAAQVGFNLVMLADAGAEHAELVRRVAAVVRLSHLCGAAVEAELGELPCGAGETGGAHGSLTDPDLAAAFVRETGVDLLAVTRATFTYCSTVSKSWTWRNLAEIRRKVNVPLVLHGGTGIASDSLVRAIALGVAKVNYGTYLKQRYLAALGNRWLPATAIRITCWAVAGRAICWCLSAKPCATPFSNVSNSWAVAEKREPT